jgi:hypothetical protein
VVTEGLPFRNSFDFILSATATYGIWLESCCMSNRKILPSLVISLSSHVNIVRVSRKFD